MVLLALLAILNMDPLVRAGCDPVSRHYQGGLGGDPAIGEGLDVQCADGRRLLLTQPPSCDEPMRCAYLPNSCIEVRTLRGSRIIGRM